MCCTFLGMIQCFIAQYSDTLKFNFFISNTRFSDSFFSLNPYPPLPSSEPQLLPVGMVLEGSSEALCPPPSLELRPSCNKSQPSPPLGSSSQSHDGVFSEDKEPVKYGELIVLGWDHEVLFLLMYIVLYVHLWLSLSSSRLLVSGTWPRINSIIFNLIQLILGLCVFLVFLWVNTLVLKNIFSQLCFSLKTSSVSVAFKFMNY